MLNRSTSGAGLMVASAVCFLLAAGRAYGDMRECEPDGTCFNEMKDAIGDLCGNFGPGSGGQTGSGCGAPPCQGGGIEPHSCLVGGCYPMRVFQCFDFPYEPCVDVTQFCGTLETGMCNSTMVCTGSGCPPGQTRCVCTYGVCQPDGGTTPCTPFGCGLGSL